MRNKAFPSEVGSQIFSQMPPDLLLSAFSMTMYQSQTCMRILHIWKFSKASLFASSVLLTASPLLH